MILNKLAKALYQLASNNLTCQPQRMNPNPTSEDEDISTISDSEGANHIQRVSAAPAITASINPITPNIKIKPRTHKRKI